jgi:hypothetical protein
MGLIKKVICLILILLIACLFLNNQVEYFDCSDDISLQSGKFFGDGYQLVDCLTGRCKAKGKPYSVQCPKVEEVYPNWINTNPVQDLSSGTGSFLPTEGVSQSLQDAYGDRFFSTPAPT